MGILRVFLKNIPSEMHINSLQVNEDLSDLSKQRADKSMRAITLEEYFKIMRDNAKREEGYVPGQGFPPRVHVYSENLWKGYFEQTRTTTLEEASRTTERVHVRGRYDLVANDQAEKLEQSLLKALEEGSLEGQVMGFIGQSFPREKRNVPTGIITIGMWPCMTFEMQSLQARILRELLSNQEIHYDSEIRIVYAKESMFKNFPVTIELKGGETHIRLDRRKKKSQVITIRSADLVEPIDGDQSQFDDLIPPKSKDDPTYFASTIVAGKGKRYY